MKIESMPMPGNIWQRINLHLKVLQGRKELKISQMWMEKWRQSISNNADRRTIFLWASLFKHIDHHNLVEVLFLLLSSVKEVRELRIKMFQNQKPKNVYSLLLCFSSMKTSQIFYFNGISSIFSTAFLVLSDWPFIISLILQLHRTPISYIWPKSSVSSVVDGIEQSND